MPKRVQITWRKKGGKKPENVVSVARPTKFGNPFRIGVDAKNNSEAVQKFREWVMGDSLGANLMHVLALSELAGKDLACYCKHNEPCHADVLLEIANPLPPKGTET